MARYVCSVCGYVYDEATDGTRWAELPAGWTCPVCGSPKSIFQPAGDSGQAGSNGSGTSILSPHAALAHRIFGYVFLTIYVVLMFQMVPRLWTYQIEFAPRTAIHIAVGISIGAILLLKIGIVRFFRRLDQPLVPILGTVILVGSVVLIGISVPSALREALATRKLFTEENQGRVRELLAQTDLDEAGCERFSSLDSLRAGQQVLRQKCVSCHDLRTVLAKPRTPQRWRQTVGRMADRASLLDPLAEKKQWQVTAYLVALSPELQQSAQQLRREQDRQEQAKKAAQAAAKGEQKAGDYDAAAAKQLFETKCSQCHKTKLVSQSPPQSAEDARELVSMMVEEGLEATSRELAQIIRYLSETYGN